MHADRDDSSEEKAGFIEVAPVPLTEAAKAEAKDNTMKNMMPTATRPAPPNQASALTSASTSASGCREVDELLSSAHAHSKSRGRGRARLPEKLMGHLNEEAVPDVLWWLPGAESFAIESSRVQTELLDVHFRGTKLSSFIRSLNRW